MDASSKFSGPISSDESRITLRWLRTDDASQNLPSGIGPGPGGTLDSQWDIGTKKIRLYNILSKPWHNMQDVTFMCEFDRNTNLAPNPGGTDPSESPETDPLEFVGPNNPPAVYYQESNSGSALSTNTFDIGTLKKHEDDSSYTFNNNDLSPVIDTESNLYLTQYWLRIMDFGNNQGYYPIKNNTGNTITIDPLDRYGSLTAESSLNIRICKFTRGDGSNIVNTSNDIQVDLQSGKYYAHVFIHVWPSIWNSNKLHTFKITPYYLTNSALDSSGIIPIWSFQCKSVVQEYDQFDSEGRYGAELKNYWGNYS